MKRAIRMLAFGVLIGSQAAASLASAAIPRVLYRQPNFLAMKFNFSKGMIASAIQPVESTRDIDYETVRLIIPSDLNPDSNGSQIASQILDHSLSNFFNSPQVRNSDLGRTASKVEKTMEGDVAIGGGKPNSIQHTFKFAMRAAQTKALLEYSGLTNAQLSYQIAQSKLDFEVHEEIASATQVVFNHVTQSGESTDVLSLRWKW